MAWRITSAPTDPGRVVVARFAVPEMVGMEVEVVSVAVIFMKNVPVCRGQPMLQIAKRFDFHTVGVVFLDISILGRR